MYEFRINKLFADLFTYGTVCVLPISGEFAAMENLSKQCKSLQIIDGKKLDNVRAYSKFIDQKENEFYYQLYLKLESAIRGSGSGPIAPCFDEFDYRFEQDRGKWYVIESKKWAEIINLFKKN